MTEAIPRVDQDIIDRNLRSLLKLTTGIAPPYFHAATATGAKTIGDKITQANPNSTNMSIATAGLSAFGSWGRTEYITIPTASANGTETHASNASNENAVRDFGVVGKTHLTVDYTDR